MVKDLGLKYFLCGLILIVGCMVRGQDSLLLADSVVVHETLTKRVVEETAAQKEQLIDGIVAVVGDGIVLKSDYESKLLQLKEQGVEFQIYPLSAHILRRLDEGPADIAVFDQPDVEWYPALPGVTQSRRDG